MELKKVYDANFISKYTWNIYQKLNNKRYSHQLIHNMGWQITINWTNLAWGLYLYNLTATNGLYIFKELYIF